MSTLTVYPDPNPESTTVDGYIRNSVAETTWAAVHDAADGTGAFDDGATAIIRISTGGASDTWAFLSRAAFLFDTSSLGADATISAATLSIYGSTKDDVPGWTMNVNVYSSSPASNTSLATGDFDAFGTTAFSTAIAYASYSASSYNDFALNASGLAAIAQTGVSKFGCRNANYDVANTAPAWSSAVSAQLQCYSADQADTTNDPKLVVTYTVPATTGFFQFM